MFKLKYNIIMDYSRDDFLTSFAKSLLRKYYIKDSKLTYQEFFATVACNYSDNEKHAQYMYDIISKLYFLPATPVMSNAIYCNTENSTNLPISCYLNSIQNNKISIMESFIETMNVALADGGLGTNWSHLSSVGEFIDNQPSLGCIPLIKTQSYLLRCLGGRTREYGSGAAYLRIDHPEIEAFIDMRKPAVGGDQEMKTPRYMHHGIIITNDFLNKVEKGEEWCLKEVTTEKTVKTLSARSLWEKILKTRVETGEPFLVFIDNVNEQRPEILKKNKLKIEMSNLCTEILLPTGVDHLGKERTAICCLGSINLLHFDEWKKEKDFFYFIGLFLDNVRLDFIKRSTMNKAVYSSKRGGDIGLGISGYSNYLQKNNIDIESPEANIENIKIFKFIKENMNEVSYRIACTRGACEDAQDLDIMERFTHKIALKPDGLMSFIFNVSPNTEATLAIYSYKTLHGSHIIKNPIFEKLLKEKNKDEEEVWQSILSTGTINHLTFLTDEEKKIFKSPYEIHPMVIIEQAAARQKYICQSASLNLRIYLPISAKLLHEIHFNAARMGIKTMYYLEAKSPSKIENEFLAKKKEKEKEEMKIGNTCIGCE